MALTTVTLHGEILDPDGLTPAVGTVTFRTLIELRDVVDNIVYMPAEYVATLDVSGEFTIVLPATDNPDITPLNWVYQVYISTTTWRSTQYVQLPFSVGTTEFADLTPLDYDPCVGLPAPTPLPPDAEALFVLKTGDTMTGNLIVDANITATGSIGVTGLGTFGVSVNTPLVTATTVNATSGNFTNITGDFQTVTDIDVMRLLVMGQSTAVISGGEITINADPTKIDISATTGYVVDYNSSAPLSPTNPTMTYVNAPAQIGITPAFVPSSWFRFTSAGALVQQSTRPTPTQRRQGLTIGSTITSGGVVVIDQTLPVIPSQPANQFQDLTEALGAFSTSGNVISPNGVNLSINKTVGNLFFRAFNQVPTYTDPHNSILAAQAPVQFRRITAVPNPAAPIVTLLDVANYDPGALGVVTPVGGGANTSTNFRVWATANSVVSTQILIQYGQNTYASLALAVAGIGSGSYIPNPIVAAAALLGWISVTRTATDLSDPAQATFTFAGKFATP